MSEHRNHVYIERMDGSRYCWLCTEYEMAIESGVPFTWRDPFEEATMSAADDVDLLVERYRKALMAKHADDWTMEVISEAAHICAQAHEGRP
jgi:hypothetical protein